MIYLIRCQYGTHRYWNAVQAAFACTANELPNEAARRAHVPALHIAGIDCMPSFEVAAAYGHEWIVSATTPTAGAQAMRTPETHFNYQIQAWITNGRVDPCGHPATMRANGRACCAAAHYLGQTEEEAEAQHAAQTKDSKP